jgi:hypothetical protein
MSVLGFESCPKDVEESTTCTSQPWTFCIQEMPYNNKNVIIRLPKTLNFCMYISKCFILDLTPSNRVTVINGIVTLFQM